MSKQGRKRFYGKIISKLSACTKLTDTASGKW